MVYMTYIIMIYKYVFIKILSKYFDPMNLHG